MKVEKKSNMELYIYIYSLIYNKNIQLSGQTKVSYKMIVKFLIHATTTKKQIK